MGGVAFLGVEGSGKTVLTSAFISTFKQHAADQSPALKVAGRHGIRRTTVFS